jgi:hypothetical protein
VSPLRIAHDIPGRLRVRIPVGAQTEGLEAAVGAQPGVAACTWSPRTRSLLVLYDSAHADRAAITDAVARATGRDAPPATGANGHAPTPEPGAALAQGVNEMFGEIDQRVRRASRGLLGLAGVLPVALTAWAVAELMRGRAAPLAWSSALWYAHGLFRDYQVPATRD